MGVIICDHDYDIDANIRNYRVTGWNAMIESCVQAGSIPTQCTGLTPFSPQAKNRSQFRYSTRHAIRQYGKIPGKIPLAAVQATVKQFVIHHDGLAFSDQCFHVLQNERGLSCHFLIDNDGTIYQTLDLAMCGFHASEYNPISIGVEMANRGEFDGPTGKFGQYYADKKRFPDEHAETWCKIHNSKIHCYDFTKAQVSSLSDLAKALTKLLPNIALDYPQDVPGHVNKSLVLPNAWGFSGYIGHYHLTTRKWDPGPFDFKAFIDKLRGSLCFPVWTGKPDVKPEEKPQIPESLDELDARTKALYDINEGKAEGGYFPVGPWGDSRLWHGGVHIPQDGGSAPAPVWAPFPGRIILARMGKETSVGSANFVLVRHEMTVGPQKLKFFSLYMHLLDELKQPTPLPPWMSKDGWKAAADRAKQGEVIALDEPVEAGEVIGRFGVAGPSDTSKRQIHFEIFSRDPLIPPDDATAWTLVDGSASGRFCEVPEIIEPIDVVTPDGILQPRELTDFFTSSGDRQSFRKLAVFCVSEWTDQPDWAESLRSPVDFHDLPPAEIDALVEEQIKPGLWWTDANAHAAHLWRDGMAWHYHPLRFIQWINERLLEAAANPDAGGDAPTTEGTAGMTSDCDENSDDTDMFNQDVADGRDPYNDAIDLPHLVEGYDGEPELDE